MDDTTRAEFAALLVARRAELEASSRARAASAAELLAARGADSADDEHDPEGSTLSAEWSMLEGVRAGERHERDEIDDALARLDAGTYGVCARCGDDIPLERLRIRPTATTCVPCASR